MKTTTLASLLLCVIAFTGLQSCVKENDNVFTCPESVTDTDGNFYPVIKIGNQCWTALNLKTSRYNDGTSIITGLSASQWSNTTTGAYAIYNDNAANNDTYGKLYNGYAVSTGKLCPLGWHIPTDEEFNELEKFLGLSETELNNTGERGTTEAIGGKLKSIWLWDAPNTGATNSSGFDAVPAGTRNSVGDYIVLNQYTDFWTSTNYASDNNYLWDHHLYYNGSGVGRIYQTKDKGYSCRCVKNK